jgi:hypothetical protein
MWAETFPYQGSVWTLHNRQKELRIHINGYTTTVISVSANDKKAVNNIAALNISHVGGDEPVRWAHGELALRNVVQRARVATPLGHNKVFIVGSPRGFNFLANEFGCTKDHPEEAWETGYFPRRVEDKETNTRYAYYIRCAKSKDNVLALDKTSYEATLKEYSPEMYKQEAEGHLVSFHGLVIREFDRQKIMTNNDIVDILWKGISKRNKIGTLDFGATSCNLIVGRMEDGTIVIPDMWYKDATRLTDPLTAQGISAIELGEKYGVEHWLGDSAANTGIIPFLKNFKVGKDKKRLKIGPVKRKDWNEGISRIKALCKNVLGETSIIIANRCEPLRDELEGYLLPPQDEIDTTKPLSQQTSGPDHAIDCLSYAVLYFRNNNTELKCPIYKR